MQLHEIYDLDSVKRISNEVFLFSPNYICQYVQLCEAERSFFTLPASTGNRRASDEHHFRTPKYKVSYLTSLIHPINDAHL